MARRPLPPLNALRAFEAAARLGSLLEAAAELGVTPGAVSRQVKHLEEQLGVPLFERRHRAIEPTAAGRAYAEMVGSALDGIADATLRVSAPRRPVALSISAYPTFAIRWLVPRWVRFYDRHPGIDLQLTTSLEPVDLARDGFDAATHMGPPDVPGIEGMRLAPVELFPVCSPAFLAEAGPIAGTADLARLTLLHSAPRPDDWPRWLAAEGAAEVRGARDLRFESLNLAFQAAIEGLGVAMGIGALIESDLAQGRLVRALPGVRRSGRAFHLAWRRERARDPRLAAFLAWLREEAERAEA